MIGGQVKSNVIADLALARRPIRFGSNHVLSSRGSEGDETT
jgi:hypothetical protein